VIETHDCRKSDSKICFYTHYSLSVILAQEETAKNISVVIIDEAHERLIDSDLLVSLAKYKAQHRQLKIIICSATLKSDLFKGYFGQIPYIEIPGISYETEIRYDGPYDDSYNECSKI